MKQHQKQIFGIPIKTHIVILALILLFCLLYLYLVGMVSAISIDPGICYEYNQSVPSSNTSQLVNETFCCTTNQTSIILNQTLNPGEHALGNQSICGYDFTCNQTNTNLSSQVCDLTKTLKNGETYTLQNNVCNLSVDCEYTTTKTTTPLEYDTDFKIYRENDTIFIKWQNQTKSFDATAKQWSYTNDFTYSCSEASNLDEMQESKDFVQMCENVLGSNDWLPRTLEKCFDQRDVLINQSNDFNQERTSMQVDLDRTTQLYYSCQADNNATRLLVDSANQQNQFLKEDMQAKLDEATGWRDALLGTTLTFFLLCLFMGFFLLRMYRGGQWQ